MSSLMILFFATVQLALAQVSPPGDIIDPSKGDLRSLQQNGSLVSVRLFPGQPLLIYVVGREEAKIDLSRLKLSVRRLSQGQSQDLPYRQEGRHYIIDEPLSREEPTDLEVTAQTPKKAETFHFKLTNTPR